MPNHFFIMSYRNTEAWEFISGYLGRDPELEELQDLGEWYWVNQEIPCRKFENVEDAVMWFQQNWKDVKPYIDCYYLITLMMQRKIMKFPDNPNGKITFNKDYFKKNSK